jgi:hypothetical protein
VHHDQADDPGDQPGGGAQPLVVAGLAGLAGLAGQGGKQVGQPGAGKPQPATFGWAAEQDLGDGETDQLGVGQSWWPAQVAPGCTRSSMAT